MPLTISIDRANQLQIEDGSTVVTEFFFAGGEDVSFRYAAKTFETMTCVSVVGSNAPVTYSGRAGKLVHPTLAVDTLYTLEFSATVAGPSSAPQPSNVKFTLKKKSSGTKSPGIKGQGQGGGNGQDE